MASLSSLFVTLSTSAILSACGGSVTSDVDAGTVSTGGSSTGGSSSTSCDVVSATATQVGLCGNATACALQQCSSAFASCMGANYASGTYAGAPCSDYANCVKNCSCVATCTSSCGTSANCNTCLNTDLLYCVAQSSCAAVAYKCTSGSSS